ncbi:MAG: TIGR03862 family flavoprotein [Pseudomonadota bacterium]
MSHTCDALVIGGGPAGLAAAEVLSGSGHSVLVAEAKPSLGRKFLMAGKSGLNLTKAEPPEVFLGAYPEGDCLAPMLAAFGPDEMIRWAEGLGQPVFTGSSGRVFPEVMKGSPLLRAWLARLAAAGVEVRTRWRWTGWEGKGHRFATPGGSEVIAPKTTIFALGGASWARLGSDGAWASAFAGRGIPLAPFTPANMGFARVWSDHMHPHFGAPVKDVALTVDGHKVRGEFVLSSRGVEGSAIYAVSRLLRDPGATLTLDLLPTLTETAVSARLARPRGKASLTNHLRKTLRLPPVKLALLREAGPVPPDNADLARRLKALPLALDGPRPLDEAISVAGGVAWQGLTDDLELTACPGQFCAGEMLDWEAPTGGYLLTACLATGRWAGHAAARICAAS